MPSHGHHPERTRDIRWHLPAHDRKVRAPQRPRRSHPGADRRRYRRLTSRPASPARVHYFAEPAPTKIASHDRRTCARRIGLGRLQAGGPVLCSIKRQIRLLSSRVIRRVSARPLGPLPSLSVTLSIGIILRATFDPAPIGLVCWRPPAHGLVVRFMSRQHPAAAWACHAGTRRAICMNGSSPHWAAMHNQLVARSSGPT